MLLNRISLGGLCPVVSPLYPVMNIFDFTKDWELAFLIARLHCFAKRSYSYWISVGGIARAKADTHIIIIYILITRFTYRAVCHLLLPTPSRGRSLMYFLLQLMCTLTSACIALFYTNQQWWSFPNKCYVQLIFWVAPIIYKTHAIILGLKKWVIILLKCINGLCLDIDWES